MKKIACYFVTLFFFVIFNAIAFEDSCEKVIPATIEAFEGVVQCAPCTPHRVRFAVKNSSGEALAGILVNFISYAGYIPLEMKMIETDQDGVVECPYVVPDSYFGGTVVYAKVVNLPLYAATIFFWDFAYSVKESFISFEGASLEIDQKTYLFKVPTNLSIHVKGKITFANFVYPNDKIVGCDFYPNPIEADFFGEFDFFLPWRESPGVEEFFMWIRGCEYHPIKIIVEYYEE